MKLAITGSKHYQDNWLVNDILAALPTTTQLVLPTMTGPNLYAEEFARRNNMPRPIFCGIPKSEKDKDEFREACRLRNKRIVDLADAMIALWMGDEYNTKQCLEMMALAGKPVLIIGAEPPPKLRQFYIQQAKALVDLLVGLEVKVV